MVSVTISKRGGLYVFVFNLPDRCLGAVQVDEVYLSDEVIADVLMSLEDGVMQ